LTPYYRLELQDQTISPRNTATTVAEDITAHIVGLEYIHGSLALSAEYEDHDSTTIPYESIRWNGNLSHHFEFGAVGGLSATWSKVDYEEPNDRKRDHLSIGGRWRHTITPRLSGIGSVQYRNDDDTLTGDDDGIDVDLSLEWSMREVEIKIGYEYGHYNNIYTRNDSSFFYIEIRRLF
jgi:hypothetical protein